MAERVLSSALVACGGTGGHVYPAIAIARALMGRHPAASVSFVGRPDSFEAATIAREGFAMDPLVIGRLVGQSIMTRIQTLAQLPLAVARAARILSSRHPQVVIGTGGFVSGPTVLAAALCRIPIVVQEQNAVPGMTNRVLCALADRVALAHPQPGRDARKYRVTGNPVRRAFFDVPDWRRQDPFVLLVMGGSQGARQLNEVVLAAAMQLGDIAGRLRIVLQTGPRWEADARARAASAPVPVEVQAYLEDVPRRLAAASLVACRSGASTIAELCAAGRPSLLVPFPHAAGDHQTHNARALAAAGAAEWRAEVTFTPDWLAARLRSLVADQSGLERMARAARDAAHPDAADAVVALAAEVAR